MRLHLRKRLSQNAVPAVMSDDQTIENAPTHVKLAIDLILLLEQHEIDAKTALQALEIVQKDFENKLNQPT